MQLPSILVSLLSTLPHYFHKPTTHLPTEKQPEKTLGQSATHVHTKGLPNNDTQSLIAPTFPEGHDFDFSSLDDMSMVVPIETAAGPLNKDLIANYQSNKE